LKDLPLGPVAAPEAVDAEEAVAESGHLPFVAERHAGFAAGIEKIRPMAGLAGAMPAVDGHTRGSCHLAVCFSR